MKVHWLLIVGVALISGRVEAQGEAPGADAVVVGAWRLTPLVEVRSRGELWLDPVDMGGTDAATGISTERVRTAGGVLLRSRLGLGAEREAIRVQLTLQDVRAWGGGRPDAVLGGNDPFASFGPYETYVEARTRAARPSFLRVGRQAVTWGEGRLLSSADGAPSGRSLDAFRGVWVTGTVDVEVLAALLDTPRPLGMAAADLAGPSRSGGELLGGRVGWTVEPWFRVEAVGLVCVSDSAGGATGSDFLRAQRQGETYTGSVRVSGGGAVSYGLEGAYQMGRAALVRGGADRRAFAVSGHIASTFGRVRLSPTVRVGGSYASGDDGAGEYKQFDPMLPDVRTFYGPASFVAGSNLVEGHVRLGLVPFADTALSFGYHMLRLAESKGEWLNGYLLPVGRGSTGSADLGHQGDVGFSWVPWSPVTVSLGYTLLVLGDGAKGVMGTQGRGGAVSSTLVSPPSLTQYGFLQIGVRLP